MSNLINDILSIITAADNCTYIKPHLQLPFSYSFINHYNLESTFSDDIMYCENQKFDKIFNLFVSALSDCLTYDYNKRTDKTPSKAIYFNDLISLGIIYFYFTKEINSKPKPIIVSPNKINKVYTSNDDIEEYFNNWILNYPIISKNYISSSLDNILIDFSKVIGWLMSYCLDIICNKNNKFLINYYLEKREFNKIRVKQYLYFLEK